MSNSKTSKPAYAAYGEPMRGIIPAHQHPGSKMASASAPYTGRNRCIANNDTCEGPQAKGTEYCIGHLRSTEKGNDVT
jgi:hypothetical protein